MNVVLNGEPTEIEDGVSLAELLETLIGSTRGSAAAVNGSVVPRADWPDFRLADGHRIELITAVQGG